MSKAYQIVFTYNAPGHITLVAANEQEVREKFDSIMSKASGVEVLEINDYDDVPALKMLREEQDKRRVAWEQEQALQNANVEGEKVLAIDNDGETTVKDATSNVVSIDKNKTIN